MAMRRAELHITLGGWSQISTTHSIGFDSIGAARSEFERISALLKKRGDKGNEVPKFLDVKGINELTCDFDQVNAVSLSDLKKVNDSEKGLKDEYPHLKWK